MERVVVLPGGATTQGRGQSPPTHLFEAYRCWYVHFNSGASACVGHVCNEVMPECSGWKPRDESLGFRTLIYLPVYSPPDFTECFPIPCGQFD